MADSIEFSLIGMDSLLGKLDSVSKDIKYKGGRYALRKAAQVIREAAKQNASRIDDPETAADISKNIVERWSSKRFKQSGDLAFRVGVMGGAGGNLSAKEQSGLPGGDTRHFRYVEFGTEDTQAQPFLRPALEQNIDAATSAFLTAYEKALDRAIKRAAKKAAKI
ncbi:HK97-gp10 family putative phage morphogenesis protein [Pseudomonas luteola]|uniref:HK97-gp10 family putative phage morphogenesis protein n=1 Tax=Pseudomonas luteola TaxID=47886 RepID=UPI001238AD3F|nr:MULTISPECIES: HK97-gp10 family putative phage morphogenesis protein [Pseudomonas]MBA1249847.1 HK97 gp10 family phage protein [Pseudomonas zeshuii]QEU28844.1 HK97 gp10 family phage protein [Pseudomonas luteola]